MLQLNGAITEISNKQERMEDKLSLLTEKEVERREIGTDTEQLIATIVHISTAVDVIEEKVSLLTAKCQNSGSCRSSSGSETWNKTSET